MQNLRTLLINDYQTLKQIFTIQSSVLGDVITHLLTSLRKNVNNDNNYEIACVIVNYIEPEVKYLREKYTFIDEMEETSDLREYVTEEAIRETINEIVYKYLKHLKYVPFTK